MSDSSSDDPSAPDWADEDTATVEADDDAAEVDLTEADAATAERDQLREMAQRLQAEFENYRKRVAKQQSETSERANESLVTKLLPVLDTMDLALAHEPNETLEQVRATLLSVLTKGGLERIDAREQPFDPELHEAVAHEPGEGEPQVTEDLRAGYLWKGRVIRPSMVKVMGS